MIGINNLGAPYALPYLEKISMLPEHFLKRSAKFHPQPLICPGRGPMILTLEACFIVLADLLGLRLLSRKWMRFGSYSLSHARKTFISWNASKTNIFRNLVFNFSKLSFFQSETSNFPLSSNTSWFKTL